MQLVYVSNAPSALIESYEERLAKEKPPKDNAQGMGPFLVLQRLISKKKMERVWTVLAKHSTEDELYLALYKAIIKAMALARRGLVPQTKLRNTYRSIAYLAGKLKKLIGLSQGSSATSSYRPELDFVAEVLEPDWERFEELLERLRQGAIQKTNEPISKQMRKRQGNKEHSGNGGLQTKARLFACYLDDAITKLINRSIPPNIFIAITSVLYDPGECYLGEDSLKQAIHNHRKHRVARRIS